jgi:hypothetical protein
MKVCIRLIDKCVLGAPRNAEKDLQGAVGDASRFEIRAAFGGQP